MVIYAHKNKINGKYYVGQTSRKPKRRWNNGNGYIGCRKFQEAIEKYGWNNFEHIILCECDKNEADFLEEQFIKYFDSVDNGYNVSYGGKSKIRYDDTTLKIWSAQRKGKHFSPNTEFKKGNVIYHYIPTKEQKEKHSKIMKEYYKTHNVWNKDKKMSKELFAM